MARINLDDAFARKVLEAAHLDPDLYDAASLVIDYVPGAERVTVRATTAVDVDASILRLLIKTAATDRFKGAPAVEVVLAEVETRLDEVTKQEPVKEPPVLDLPIDVVKERGIG